MEAFSPPFFYLKFLNNYFKKHLIYYLKCAIIKEKGELLIQDKYLRNLKVGDQVLYVTSDYYGRLVIKVANVTGFTEKRVKISFYKSTEEEQSQDTMVSPEKLVKLERIEVLK